MDADTGIARGDGERTRRVWRGERIEEQGVAPQFEETLLAHAMTSRRADRGAGCCPSIRGDATCACHDFADRCASGVVGKLIAMGKEQMNVQVVVLGLQHCRTRGEFCTRWGRGGARCGRRSEPPSALYWA